MLGVYFWALYCFSMVLRFVIMSVLNCFDYYSLVLSFKIRMYETPIFLSNFKIVIATQDPFSCYMNFRTDFLIFVKEAIGISGICVLRNTNVLAIFVFQTMNIGGIFINLFFSVFLQCFYVSLLI